jgi:hypothetical protein
LDLLRRTPPQNVGSASEGAGGPGEWGEGVFGQSTLPSGGKESGRAEEADEEEDLQVCDYNRDGDSYRFVLFPSSSLSPFSPGPPRRHPSIRLLEANLKRAEARFDRTREWPKGEVTWRSGRHQIAFLLLMLTFSSHSVPLPSTCASHVHPTARPGRISTRPPSMTAPLPRRNVVNSRCR